MTGLYNRLITTYNPVLLPANMYTRTVLQMPRKNRFLSGLKHRQRMFNNLKQSVSNLIQMHGRTNNLKVGLGINTTLMIAGIAVALALEGWVSLLGILWAILHAVPIAKWVVSK